MEGDAAAGLVDDPARRCGAYAQDLGDVGAAQQLVVRELFRGHFVLLSFPLTDIDVDDPIIAPG